MKWWYHQIETNSCNLFSIFNYYYWLIMDHCLQPKNLRFDLRLHDDMPLSLHPCLFPPPLKIKWTSLLLFSLSNLEWWWLHLHIDWSLNEGREREIAHVYYDTIIRSWRPAASQPSAIRPHRPRRLKLNQQSATLFPPHGVVMISQIDDALMNN